MTEFDVEKKTGTRVPVRAADPKLPTREEVDTHNLTHLLYRSEGKVRLWTTLIPDIHVDYCFMGSKIDAATICIVVAKDYHLRENKYRYRSEIKSKTFGL